MSTAAPGSAAPGSTENGSSAGAAPRVSVVVPIYNVERYLRECLESLAHQTMGDLEVVMVDDGSTDSSAAIAAAFAAEDDRFVLVQQANGGLGNARNTGAARARGEYLAFVDSDDVVTERAYELLAGTLDKTGSDFASGNFHRLTTTGTRQAGMVFTAFNAYRPRTHVTRHPALLNDRTAWNKLFRRTFWDKHAFRWPEGVLYEDIPVTLPAHVLAEAVDVVREPVYLWRARSGDSTSITQRRVELRAIRDRHSAVDGVSRFMAERGETALKALYDKSVAAQDLRYFLQHLDEGDHAFHERFLELANDYFDRAAPDVFDDLPAIQRLEWHLVRRRLLPELLEVVRFENSGDLPHTPFVKRGRRFYGSYPFRGDGRLQIPDEVYRLTKDELPMPARVQDVWWDGEVLHLSGFAYISFLPLPSERSGRLRITLEESGHPDRVVPLTVRKVRRPDLTAASPDGVTSYDWSGWEASVPVSALRHGGRFRTGTWRLRIEVRVDGVTRRRWVSATEPGRAMHYSPRTVGGTRFTTTTPAGHFSLQVSTEHAEVNRAELDGDVLELGGTLVGREFDPVTATLRVARDDGTASHPAPVATDVRRGEAAGGVPFVTRLDLRTLSAARAATPARQAEDAGNGAVWELSLLPDAATSYVPVVASGSLPEPGTTIGSSEVVLRVSRTGRVQLIDRTVRPEVDDASWERDTVVVLSGRYDVAGGEARELVLQHRDRAVRLAVPMTCEAGRFTARLDLAALPTPGGPVPLAEGRWLAYVRPVGEPGTLVGVKVAREALPALPRRAPSGWRTAAVLDMEERTLAVDLKGELPPGDRTRVGRQRLVGSAFGGALREPLLDQVLVDGFAGGGYGDDVRAVLEALGDRTPAPDLVWTTDDGLATGPAGARPVPRHGRDWYAALGRSRFVLATDLMGVGDLARRPEQVVVQAGHGIAARPVGLDDEHARTRLGGPERIRDEAARWTVVLSAGPAHTKVLRAAFGVEGTVAETGLPRHDLLVDPGLAAERDARTAKARERLGLSPGQRVVLWAPSHADRLEVAADRYRLDLGADPADLASALGDGHVLVVRPHPKVVDRVGGDGLVVDGSWLPDVRDLLLAADVLVTDRSSLLFDFAMTGRPMVFFRPAAAVPPGTPPAHYVQPDALPGRVVTDGAELADAIALAHDEAPDHAEARTRLLDTWVPLRDGKATARVLAAMLSAHPADAAAAARPTTTTAMEET